MMINQVVKLPISQKYQGARSRKCGLLSIFFCAVPRLHTANLATV